MAGGKRRAQRQGHGGPRVGALSRLGGTVLGIVLGGVAWWVLVRAAIDFGHLASLGQSRAWLFTAVAAAGAAVCLLLVLVLVSRLLVALGVVSRYQPRRAAPRRRGEPQPGSRKKETAGTRKE